MGENHGQSDQHLETSNNHDCSIVVAASSCALNIKDEKDYSPISTTSAQETQTQSQPQSQHVFPICTGLNSLPSVTIPSSSASSSSSLSIGHSSIEQPGINQPTFINNQAPSAFLNQNSAMNSTFNSSMSSLDRGSPTIGNQNLNHNNNVVFNTADYLAQLLKDRKQLSAFPNVFHHVERLIDDEISKVRGNLFQLNGTEKRSMVLPEPDGQVLLRTEKVYVPVKDFPDYNFVGRILGPRGMTAKQLEQETGCKIMVRGRGSMRDKKKEEMNRGKPNWEHLSDELHVLITCEDTPNRAEVKLERAKEEIRKLLIPVTDGDDDLKKRQLMELAILNGTYRDPSAKLDKENEIMKMAGMMGHPSVASLGSPLILGPPGGMMRGLMTPGGVPSLMNSHDGHSFLYDPYAFAQYPMGHLIATEFGSTTGQGMDSMSTEDKRKKRRLN